MVVLVHHKGHKGCTKGHDGTEPLAAAVERVGRAVLDAAFAVHKALGPGLLESAYEACMAEELRRADLRVKRQVGLPVAYGDVRMDVGYRLDLLVEDSGSSRSNRSTPWRRSIALGS